MSNFKIYCLDSLWDKYKNQIIEDNQLWRFPEYERVSSVDGADLVVCSVKDEFLNSLRGKDNRLFYCPDATIEDVESIHNSGSYKWERFNDNGWEVTSAFDGRFSPMFMRIDGETIENIYHLDIKGFRNLGYKSWKECKGLKPFNIVIRKNNWTRLEAKMHPERLYIFTDNVMRTSGNNLIEDGCYYEKYNELQSFIAHPTMTQAVLRGLPNAFPISTMYNSRKVQIREKMTLDEISEIWKDEVNTVLKAWNTGNYTEIHISSVQFGNGKYSRIINYPTYFNKLNNELRRININNEFYTTPIVPYRSIEEQYSLTKSLYSKFLMEHIPLLYELVALGNNYVLTDRYATTDNTQAHIYADILNEV